MKKIFVFSILSLSVVGCSSAPKSGVEHAGEEKIISRIDDLGSRPNWVKESEPFRIEDGKVYSLGMTTIPADNNISAAYRIAANNGKALVSHAIEQKLDFVFQNAEEGTAMDANQARYIGAEASKLTSSSLRTTRQYWEKAQIVQENGQPVVRYRVFSLTEMPENDFKSAIFDAIRRANGRQGISAEFAKKVDQHWDRFVNADVPVKQGNGQNQKDDERKPAQDDKDTQ